MSEWFSSLIAQQIARLKTMLEVAYLGKTSSGLFAWTYLLSNSKVSCSNKFWIYTIKTGERAVLLWDYPCKCHSGRFLWPLHAFKNKLQCFQLGSSDTNIMFNTETLPYSWIEQTSYLFIYLLQKYSISVEDNRLYVVVGLSPIISFYSSLRATGWYSSISI